MLRFFIKQLNIVLPSRTNLQRILTEVCHAAVDGQPQVSWSQYIARRYQNTLYISRLTQQPLTLSSVNLLYDQQPILLDADHQLVWKATRGEGIRAELFRSGLALTFRQGGEKIQLAGKSHHQSLKKLFQEWQIPVWQRDSIPLLFASQQLVAIVGYACAEIAKPLSDETGWLPVIEQT